MEIPYTEISKEALRGIIEQFVTRDDNDSSHTLVNLEDKIKEVHNMLKSSKAVIVYDQLDKSCNIILKEDYLKEI
ncbi:MAG: YheU family protein [Desulfobacterales bacterium]|nr:YheU family protein [Desulfobacterales bacterium]MCP4163131.1 YheU family protein [Deltaproteobacteria bacterium]